MKERKKFFPDAGGIDMIFFGNNSIDYKRRKTKSSKESPKPRSPA